MASRLTYYPGGYDPTAPQQNRAEQWDDTARTYTAWNRSGAQTTTRPYTADENAAADQAAADATAAANGDTIRSRASAALTANGNYLAIASPSNAQNAAYLKTVAKELNALIRLVLNQLDDTTGT